MLRPELLFVDLQGVQIIWLGRFLPARLAENERNVVEHGAEVGVRQVLQLRPGRDRLLVKRDRFLRLGRDYRISNASRRAERKSAR